MKHTFDRQDFGTALHMARWQANMTMQDLADRVGASKAAVCRWENGKQEPPLVAAILVCRLLGLQISSFINEDLEGQRVLPGFEEAGNFKFVSPEQNYSMYETAIAEDDDIRWDNDLPVGYWRDMRESGGE